MGDLVINLSISLVEQLITFTSNELNFQGNISADINEVKRYLNRMQAIVQGNGARSTELTQLLVKDLRVLAYRLEDALDGIMLHGPNHSPNNRLLRKGYQVSRHFLHRRPLLEIHAEIQRIQYEMKSVSETLEASRGGNHGGCAKTELQHHVSQTLPDAEILGAEVARQKLTSHLTNDAKSFSVFVVVGPPGSGKTVIANSVYTCKKLSRRFSCRLRARLSPRFDVNDVLSLLLSQVTHWRAKKPCLGGDSATDLMNNLQGKRYLLFLDDVWSESHWRAIQHALPNDLNGSRVVLTTTKMDVASSIASSSSTHIHLIDDKELKEDQSWKLLCKKSFSKEKGICPPDLAEVAREILRKCEGNPLAVSSVGDLLSRKPRLPSEWTKVKENLRAEMETSPQFSHLNNSIQQCYDDLDANLKSCLLYFSLFAAGCDIQKGRLVRLWVAERFVTQTGEKPAEEVAEDYLNELIRRNLVISETDFDERVKTCKVRYFLHCFLTVKSKHEDFAATLDKPSARPEENVRRLSVGEPATNLLSTWQLKRVRTCLVFGQVIPYDIIIRVVNQFQKLKVLDFQGATLESFPECVVDLGLLRYLSLRGSVCVSSVPGSIKRLRYLEFLDLKHTSVTGLPKAVNQLHNLRHLLVYHYRHGAYVTFHSTKGMKMAREIGSLSSLQKLTLLKAENHRKFFYELGSLTQLQNLGLIDLKASDGKSLCSSLSKMKRLSVLDLRSTNESEFLNLDHQDFQCNLLQRVYLKGALEKLPRWIKSLTSLVRIHLRYSRLKTSPIDELQGLNNLIELHLVVAFVGEELKFGRGAFVKLKVLQLEGLAELTKVKVSKGSLGKLEKLTLCNLAKLTAISSALKRLSELKELALYDMAPELISNVRLGELARFNIATELINSMCGSSTNWLKIKVYSSDGEKRKWLEQNVS